MAQSVVYRDLNLDFKPNPLNGDIIVATNSEAIKKSLKNLILTNLYESPFDPDKGTNIYGSLFENFDNITADFLRTKIKESVDRYEQRVEIQKIDIFSKYKEHSLEITMYFKVLELNYDDNITVFVSKT